MKDSMENRLLPSYVFIETSNWIIECWKQYASEDIWECIGLLNRNMTNNYYTQPRPMMRDL
jgi:hypothetical protein